MPAHPPPQSAPRHGLTPPLLLSTHQGLAHSDPCSSATEAESTSWNRTGLRTSAPDRLKWIKPASRGVRSASIRLGANSLASPSETRTTHDRIVHPGRRPHPSMAPAPTTRQRATSLPNLKALNQADLTTDQCRRIERCVDPRFERG